MHDDDYFNFQDSQIIKNIKEKLNDSKYIKNEKNKLKNDLRDGQ